MADARRPASPQQPAQEGAERAGMDAEALLGRAAVVGLPVVCLGVSVAIGVTWGLGPALLALAFSGLVGTIALLWASLRTLTGDAPVSPDLSRAALDIQDASVLVERKLRTLRALKDLEGEHAIGKIDDADFSAIAARYRAEAKTVMREIDENAAPARELAEKMVSEFLARQGSSGETNGVADARRAPSTAPPSDAGARTERPSAPGAEAKATARVTCSKCGTSNEPDAAFCKHCGGTLAAPRGADDAS